MLVFINVALR